MKFSTAKLVKKEKISDKVLDLVFECTAPSEINYAPGQFISVKIQSYFRAYCILSKHTPCKKFSLIISAGHEGVGADYFRNLESGDRIEYVGPSGKFKLHTPLPNELNFFATGTGMSSVMAMLYQLKNEKYKGKVNLYFGVSHTEDIFFEKELAALQKDLHNFDFTIYLSRPKDKNYPYQGRLTKVLQEMKNKEAHYYLSGVYEMVEEGEEILVKNGIPETNMFH